MVDGGGDLVAQATGVAALREYTLGFQVTEPYNFTRAVRSAAREFAPDVFIVTGPGSTLGGAVAQSLIIEGWRGMKSKADFVALQRTAPLVISMGIDEQRSALVQSGRNRIVARANQAKQPLRITLLAIIGFLLRTAASVFPG